MDNEGLKKLKEMGSQKIYEDTHISRPNIDAILNGKYEEIGRVQGLGFISILEREYSVDLSRLKEAYIGEEPKVSVETRQVPAPSRDYSKEIKSRKGLIAAALIVVVFIVIVITGGDDEEELLPVAQSSVMVERTAVDEPSSEVYESMEIVESSDVEEPQIPAFPVADEADEIKQAVQPEPPEQKEIPAPEYFSIIPKTKLWMGIIDLTTKKRSVKTTRYMVELNASKSWLLVFGHGLFKIESGDETLEFKRQGKVRILFEDGMPFEIDKAEYKARNGGRNW